MKILIIKRAFFTILVLFISMSCDKQMNEMEHNEQRLSIFQMNFPNEYKNLKLEYLQNTIETKSSEISPSLGISIPVIINNEVVGRYVGLVNQSAAIYIDFTDYKNEIIVYDVIDPTRFQVFKMKYDAERDVYEPIVLKSTNDALCGALCALGAIAIAASDGPAPFMDALAITYAATCLAACVANET